MSTAAIKEYEKKFQEYTLSTPNQYTNPFAGNTPQGPTAGTALAPSIIYENLDIRS